VRLALIVAVAHNRVIGRGGTLPWHIPEDLQRFKNLTTGNAVLMGRTTYLSIGRPLPHRRNVVVTTHALPGVESYPSVELALDALKDEKQVFVIGGARLYAALLERADDLYLTFVHRDVEGDTFFPPFEHLLTSRFRETFREAHPGFTFVDYTRTGPSFPSL
jgi:dihydrofolate reductase